MSYGYPPPAQHPQHPQHQQQQQQQWYPPPQPQVDPYRAWYASQLATLTFNSRPIIQLLSQEAMKQRDQGNMAAMQAVAEEIEHAVLRAPPQGKLPLLYLIDSISKNVGPPYTDRLFASFLPRLYPKTYREVDGVTRGRMEEMLKLWRTGGPGRSELYPPGMRERVEHDIFGPGGPPLTQKDVQATLREYLKEKEDEMALEFSPALARTVNILVQIDQVLSSSQVSPQELDNIMEKIRGMKAGLDPNSIRPRQQQQPVQQQYPPRQVPQQQHFPPPPAAYHAAPNAYPPAPSFPAQNFPRVPSAVPTPPPPAAPLAMPAIPSNFADILRNLNNSGALSQPRTPEPTGNKSNLASYEDHILALDIRVEHFDLSKLSLPVFHIPERCQQCGMRFPDREGDKFRAHMDWHFRRNRKERETGGRGAHRRWLPRVEEWVKENTETPASPKAEVKETGLSAERVAALKKQWVRTPTDSNKAARPCPICKDLFKSEWNEDEEEWVFMNAVEVNGVIYHATCRAEKIASAMTARLLKEERKASLSPAPEDLKRKAEDEGGEEVKRVKLEGEDVQVKTEPEEAVEPASVPDGPPVPESDVDVKEEVVEEPAEPTGGAEGAEVAATEEETTA